MNYIDQIDNYLTEGSQEETEKRVVQDYIRLFPHNILTRENEFAHMTSSGLIMNKSLDKVLFIYHRQYNTWTWTGGHSDGETDMLGTAVREAIEETGLDFVLPLTDKMLSLDIIPVYGHMKNGRYICSHLHLNATYVLIADEHARLCAKQDEASGIQWIPVCDIDKFSNEPYLIGIYNKIIRKARDL